VAADYQRHGLPDLESVGVRFIHDRFSAHPELVSPPLEAETANETGNISNSGSFTWTPPNDSTLDGDGIGGWYLTLVDDATQETSTSTSFNILTPDAEDEFIGPYPPLVAGQVYTFNWSPSTQPTISLLIMRDSPEGPNVTLAGKDSLLSSKEVD
jgi:hypothetical protein